MTDQIKEGLGDLAHAAEKDHEVQMARADLYKLAKYAIKLHDMLKGVSEAEGLEGWVQSKITKSADMIGSVYHHMDYENSPMGEVTEAKEKASCGCGPDCDHCGGKHTMNEVGKKCECCGNTIKAVAAEGKSPHKKGTKKYKKHMAAMHAESANDPYKQRLHAKLAERSLTKDESKKKKNT